jgi:4-amino-4-deoxy-L-arabinose transferase-like glycosyltransferase
MTNSVQKHFSTIGWIFFFSLIVYGPVFMHLGNLAVRKYDEARLTNNAYQMNKNGNYLVSYYEAEPDMWNTKPPLMIWSQVFFIKIFGFNELAVRFPSALATLFLCITIFLFSFHFLKKPWLGIFAVGVLITCGGFVREHVSRTGDFDAMLTLFTTFYLLSFFVFTEARDEKNKNIFLLLFFISLTLAAMTKGIAAFIFLPAVFIFALLTKNVLVVLKNRNFYIGLFLLISVVGGYYLLRELENPGYLKKIVENELGGRYLETIEGHKHGAFFYFDNMLEWGMKHWYIYLLPGLALGLFLKEERTRNFTKYILLCGFFFFIVISSAQTKLDWYDAPLYPLIAFSVAIFLWKVFEWLKNSKTVAFDMKINVAPYVLTFLFFVTPLTEMKSKVYFPKEESWNKEAYSICYYLKEAVEGKRNVSGSYILHENYHAEMTFYVLQLKERNQTVGFKNRQEIMTGDTIIVHEEPLKNFVENNFETEIIDRKWNVVRYRLVSKCE